MSSVLSSMISTLSLADKVALNQLLADSIAKDISGTPIKPVSTETKAKKKDPNAPKKAAAPGVKAWNGFVKHCKATMPELFTSTTKEAERLAICGGIKEKDLPAYQAWVANFLTTLPASTAPSVVTTPAASDTEEAAVTEVKAKKPRKEKTPEQKAADAQKRREKNRASIVAPIVIADAEEGDMVKKTIKGKHYLMDPTSKNLYSTDEKGQSLGDYVGKFRPGDDATPIDFDAEE